jgi:hypothetical protein
MHGSEQQTEITADRFIQQACGRAAGEQAQQFEQLFADCTPLALNATEVVMLSGFLPLLAMSLARLHKDIQRRYALAFAQKVNETFGEGAGAAFPQRTLEYLTAFHQDVTSGGGSALPALLTAALDNICGVSDDSVEPCRPGLRQALIPTLRADVEQFSATRFAAA